MVKFNGDAMTLKQALKRIGELERKVAQLEARPQQQIHYHTHQMPWQQPLMQPPYPAWPNRVGDIYCGNIGAGVAPPVIGVGYNAQ